jgi:hypothetical protein
MESRRKLLTSAVALVGVTTLSAAATAALAVEAVPDHGHDGRGRLSGDSHAIALTPNDPGSASANTAALKSLVDPRGNFGGRFSFQNTTGTDIYYFNDVIPFHDGINVDLQGCTLHFSKLAERADTNAGFIFAIRDFSIANGSIVVDYQPGGGASSAGNALAFGNRGEDSRYFSPIYDSLLRSPMGNIVVRNLRISSNARGGTGILLTGGLNGVVVENVWIDGNGGALTNGIYYEFGWATNEARRELRQTSHARNMRFSNINISNVDTTNGEAVGLAGAYNCWIDGLYVRSAKILLACTPGESAFYRPWVGVDQIGAKRNISVRNVVGSGITGTALVIAGASAKSGGYLSGTQNNLSQQVDLTDFSMDGFAIDGANLDGGYGIQSSAEKMDLRNGRITNFSRGIVTTHECTRMTIESVDIVGCRQMGMQIGQQSSIWNPPRQKMGFIRNCFIAGNSVASPGAFAAVELDVCAAFIIEGNRFGYEPAHDGVPETTQGYSVRIGAQANNVVCRCNHTGGVRGGGAAYAGRPNPGTGNAIENASGLKSVTGLWEGRPGAT